MLLGKFEMVVMLDSFQHLMGSWTKFRTTLQCAF
jgi:hypothetical protein